MLKRLAVAAVMLVAFASCQKFAEGRRMFRDMLQIREEVANRFHEQNVDINMSPGGNVTIKFVNSPLYEATRDAKQKRADEVAAFVLAGHPQIKAVTTAFVSKSGALTLEESFAGAPAR